MFLDGCRDLNDNVRVGQPSAIDEDMIHTFAGFWNWMCGYWSPKLKSIFKMWSVILLSHGTILTSIQNRLKKKKVSTRCVPKILKDVHK